MYTPQAGIFALGTSSHAYLEFDLLDAKTRKEFTSTISAIREPRTTTGGVNFVIGFRPELWRDIVPDDAPPGVEGFNREIQGTEGFVMPGTQHDALVWLSGSAYDVIFDMARSVIHDLAGLATLAEETSSWPYRHDRDLTGFIDGSENPTLLDAPVAALLPEGVPGAAGSVLLLQKWKHKVAEWEALPVDQQERIMGRTKLDSVELENKPSDSHVARTDQDEYGHIFRRNMPYGKVDDHGTMFVGFSADQKRLSRMLDSMAGLITGTRDALTRFYPAFDRLLLFRAFRRGVCGAYGKTTVIIRHCLACLCQRSVAVSRADLLPEFTITAEGVYWYPVGAQDADLLVMRDIFPLSESFAAVRPRWRTRQ